MVRVSDFPFSDESFAIAHIAVHARTRHKSKLLIRVFSSISQFRLGFDDLLLRAGCKRLDRATDHGTLGGVYHIKQGEGYNWRGDPLELKVLATRQTAGSEWLRA